MTVSPGDHEIDLRIDFFGRSRKLPLRVEPFEVKHLVCAAGTVSGFGSKSNYIGLWEGELKDVAPPEMIPPID